MTFKAPKRDKDCRICKALESRGDTKHLYDGHVSNFPTGCPRYIAFSIGERRKIASEAKLCWSCHDPKYFHKPESSRKHREECVVNKGRKSRYTCTAKNCKVHMWICLKHKDENSTALEEFKKEIESKFQLDFGYVVSMPILKSSVEDEIVVRSAEQKNPLPQVSSCDPVAETTVDTVANCKCPPEGLSSDEAYDALKKKLRKDGVDVEIKPIPQGRSQFILAYTEGTTRPILQLYDTGCGGILFREGVPEKELGAVKKVHVKIPGVNKHAPCQTHTKYPFSRLLLQSQVIK